MLEVKEIIKVLSPKVSENIIVKTELETQLATLHISSLEDIEGAGLTEEEQREVLRWTKNALLTGDTSNFPTAPEAAKAAPEETAPEAAKPEPAPEPKKALEAPQAPQAIDYSKITLADLLNQRNAPQIDPEEINKIIDSKFDNVVDNFSRHVDDMIKEYITPPPREIVVKTPTTTAKIKERVNPIFDKVLKLSTGGANVFLTGPAGCGKTTLARQIAKALEIDYIILSLSEGITESKLFGRETVDGYVQGALEDAFINGKLILLDEMDAALPNVLTSLNSAIANREFLNGRNETIKAHENTVIMAAGNTTGKGADYTYTSRNQLDKATLDRFYLVAQDYDTELEKALAPDAAEYIQDSRRKAISHGLREDITTRDAQKMQLAINAGLTFEEAKKDFLSQFTEDERAILEGAK
jgi:MoxR-like ATPase